MAALDWQKNRQEIRFLLTGYYLDLYKLNNQLQVLQKNLDLTEQVIRNMESRRTQGTALKNAVDERGVADGEGRKMYRLVRVATAYGVQSAEDTVGDERRERCGEHRNGFQTGAPWWAGCRRL